MKRSIKAAVAVTALALLSLAPMAIASSGSSAGSSADAVERSVLPRGGHYEGRDSHHRHIRFTFHGNQMSHFKVDHNDFHGAHVQGHQWHHTCHDGRCTRAQWVKDTTVQGYWNIPHSGHDVPFTAHWIAPTH